MFKIKLLFVIGLTILLSSCGPNMALIKGQKNIDVSQKSIALLSVKISNQNKPDYQLELRGAMICPQSETCYSRPYWHQFESPYKREKDRFNEYLLSFNLAAGSHNISLLSSQYSSALVTSISNIPLNLKVDIKPDTIIYLGHIDAVLRERKSDKEERAAILPVIDAAIIGFSNGTFDVVVEDKFDEDMKLFTSEYPALKKVRVDKAVLPQWIRPENRSIK